MPGADVGVDAPEPAAGPGCIGMVAGVVGCGFMPAGVVEIGGGVSGADEPALAAESEPDGIAVCGMVGVDAFPVGPLTDEFVAIWRSGGSG